jgi:hypothetical protein
VVLALVVGDGPAAQDDLHVDRVVAGLGGHAALLGRHYVERRSRGSVGGLIGGFLEGGLGRRVPALLSFGKKTQQPARSLSVRVAEERVMMKSKEGPTP